MPESHQGPPISESPWFWVLIFSLIALGAVTAISGKYGRRQTVIERQYQARDRVSDVGAGENSQAIATRNDYQASRRDFASPGNQLVPLWPLTILLLMVAVLAAAMLAWCRRRPGSLSDNCSL
jgi:hypothetical protein